MMFEVGDKAVISHEIKSEPLLEAGFKKGMVVDVISDSGGTFTGVSNGKCEVDIFTENLNPIKAGGFTEFTPTTEREYELVGALLAKLRGKKVEWLRPSVKEWVNSSNFIINLSSHYKLDMDSFTPLSIDWSFINSKWVAAAMDSDKRVNLFDRKDIRVISISDDDGTWGADHPTSVFEMNVDTTGIIWNKSLTIRA